MTMPFRSYAALVLAVVPIVLAAADGNDWPSSHRDLAGQRYSPLKQITPANVATLETAWLFDTEAGPLQTIPIVAAGVMYLTGGRNVFAIEPETGLSLIHISEPTRLLSISYAVFCLKKK